MSQLLPERRTRGPAQRWEPLSEVDQAAERMRRLLDQTFGDVGWPSTFGESGSWSPPVDIEETDDAYVLEAELPGVKRGDVDIELVGNELTINGQVVERERAGILRRRTRRTERYQYRVTLPDQGDDDKIDADLKDGVLTDFCGERTARGPLAEAPRQVERVDVTEFFSDATRELLQRAAHTALEWGSLDLDTDHLLHAALADDVVRHVLRQVDADAEAISAQLEEEADKGERTDVAPSLSPDAKAALLAAYDESRELGASYVGPEHVLLALARDSESEAGRLLERFGASHTKLRGGVIRGVEPTGGARERSRTPRLDEDGRDLTQEAREGKLDPVIRRADEIDQAIEILSRRTKNNPALLGEPGVGKTAIVEGIAQRIINDEVPETLADRRVVALDLAGMIAGTKYRGEFEERLKTVIDEVRGASEELLLFVDEMHTVVGAGAAEGSMDASNMLKPALARGELHVIGATTLDEYRKNVEKDPALERRFQPVFVREPTVEEAIEILRGLRDRYEAFHRVRISDEAIVAAAELSDRYVRDRFLPDKAIDLIDQASARVRLRSKTRDDETRRAEEELRRMGRERDQAISAEDYQRADELKSQIDDRRAQQEGRKE